MKQLFLLFISFAIIVAARGQANQLLIKTGSKGLYIDHTVVPREGLYAIGRIYNVHPKAIAEYNNIDMGKGLSIGQVLHIPLTDTNFSQKEKTATPIYYKVGDKENLQKVSNAVNKVSLQNLRDWNKLSNDKINSGSKLVVGFLLLENKTVSNETAAVKEEVKKEEPKKEEPKKEEEKKVVKKEEKSEPQKEDRPVAKTEAPPSKKEEPKATLPRQDPAQMPAQGYFKEAFEQQLKMTPLSKAETVTSGIFKINTGLQEAKYYLLVDHATPGTIVRIINPENNRAVYAKVLGEMSGIRQNKGLDIRISDSAASTLGISDTEKFIVKINY